MRRFASLALVLALMVLTSSCSKQNNVLEYPNATTEKTTELKMSYITFTTIPKDLDLVVEEINKISKSKINAIIKIEPINSSAYSQRINLKLSSNEDLDMFVTGTLPDLFDYTGQVSRGQLYNLDDLIKVKGEAISIALGKDYLNASKVGGKLFGLPSLKDMSASYGFYVKKDLADKYHVDVKKIKTFNDLESLMKIMKQNEPNLYFGVSGGSTAVDNYGVASFGDTLGDGFGVLMNNKELKVKNYYETPEYAALLKTIRRWYKSGYILPNIVTNKESTTSLTKANKLYGYGGVVHPLGESHETRNIGSQMVAVTISTPIATTLSVTNFMWAIPSYSKKADKAMEFLNLMYKDKDIANLFAYGIEGKHYEKISGSDNIIDFPSGIDARNSGYNLNQAYMFGNEFLAHIWKGNPENLWSQVESFNKSAVKSKALGFSFDPTPVKTEYSSVSNVVDQYKVALENGAVDPEKVLPEFISKLKAAGIDKVIAEKQRQLDEWAKENK